MDKTGKRGFSRRAVLGGTAATVGAGALTAKQVGYVGTANAATGNSSVAPGDLDDYYGF
jgi:nitrous oxide reductase